MVIEIKSTQLINHCQNSDLYNSFNASIKINSGISCGCWFLEWTEEKNIVALGERCSGILTVLDVGFLVRMYECMVREVVGLHNFSALIECEPRGWE
jgi:hypothetical protein